MFTAVEGFKVGHYIDLDSLTGCTVVLCPSSTKASCEVRRSSPGSRELALLAPEKKMDEIHAILLTGECVRFGCCGRRYKMPRRTRHRIPDSVSKGPVGAGCSIVRF